MRVYIYIFTYVYVVFVCLHVFLEAAVLEGALLLRQARLLSLSVLQDFICYGFASERAAEARRMRLCRRKFESCCKWFQEVRLPQSSLRIEGASPEQGPRRPPDS